MSCILSHWRQPLSVTYFLLCDFRTNDHRCSHYYNIYVAIISLPHHCLDLYHTICIAKDSIRRDILPSIIYCPQRSYHCFAFLCDSCRSSGLLFRTRRSFCLYTIGTRVDYDRSYDF